MSTVENDGDHLPIPAARQDADDSLAREARQRADIEAGLREAERGDFASDAEVAATIAKFTRRTRRRR